MIALVVLKLQVHSPQLRSFNALVLDQSSQALRFARSVRRGMKLEWAIACWAFSSIYHHWRASKPSVSSAEIQNLKEELTVTRAALSNLEEGHLTCGWRLRVSNWFLQCSVFSSSCGCDLLCFHPISRFIPQNPFTGYWRYIIN